MTQDDFYVMGFTIIITPHTDLWDGYFKTSYWHRNGNLNIQTHTYFDWACRIKLPRRIRLRQADVFGPWNRAFNTTFRL